MGQFNRGNRPQFNKGNRTMYDAVCSNCGRDCQVPFRPTAGKPVLCSDCFSKNRPGGGGGGSGRDRRPDDRRGGGGDRPRVDLEKQFELLNTKLNLILQALDHPSVKKPEDQSETKKSSVKKGAVKKTAKKAATKKKK